MQLSGDYSKILGSRAVTAANAGDQFFVVSIPIGNQPYILVASQEGDALFYPKYMVDFHTEAWAFETEEEAHDEARSLNLGSYQVLPVEH